MPMNPPNDRARLAAECASMVAPLSDLVRRLIASDVTGLAALDLCCFGPRVARALGELATQLLATPGPEHRDIQAN